MVTTYYKISEEELSNLLMDQEKLTRIEDAIDNALNGLFFPTLDEKKSLESDVKNRLNNFSKVEPIPTNTTEKKSNSNINKPKPYLDSKTLSNVLPLDWYNIFDNFIEEMVEEKKSEKKPNNDKLEIKWDALLKDILTGH